MTLYSPTIRRYINIYTVFHPRQSKEMINFQTHQIVIVCFPRYAGGKFLINCLSMSAHAVFSDSRYAEAEFPQHVTEFDSRNVTDAMLWQRLIGDYYEDFKLACATDTLPASADLMHRWFSMELGCKKLFGVNPRLYHDVSTDAMKNQNFNNVIHTLSNQTDKKFFLVAHSQQDVVSMLAVWPNATVVRLHSFVNFQDLASQLKRGKSLITAEPVLTRPHLSFDVSTYFNKSAFMPALHDLYWQLKFTDFPALQIEKFYYRYAQLHGICQ